VKVGDGDRGLSVFFLSIDRGVSGLFLRPAVVFIRHAGPT